MRENILNGNVDGNLKPQKPKKTLLKLFQSNLKKLGLLLCRNTDAQITQNRQKSYIIYNTSHLLIWPKLCYSTFVNFSSFPLHFPLRLRLLPSLGPAGPLQARVIHDRLPGTARWCSHLWFSFTNNRRTRWLLLHRHICWMVHAGIYTS